MRLKILNIQTSSTKKKFQLQFVWSAIITCSICDKEQGTIKKTLSSNFHSENLFKHEYITMLSMVFYGI